MAARPVEPRWRPPLAPYRADSARRPRHFAGLLTPADLDTDRIAAARVLYCGSICLLCPPVLAAARRAWSVPGPLRVFDPNVRPRLLADPRAVGRLLEEFAASADLVKLSAADATALYGESAEQTARRLRGLGAAAVVVTAGARGALVVAGDDVLAVPAPAMPTLAELEARWPDLPR